MYHIIDLASTFMNFEAKTQTMHQGSSLWTKGRGILLAAGTDRQAEPDQSCELQPVQHVRLLKPAEGLTLILLLTAQKNSFKVKVRSFELSEYA
eukprot:12786247-Prorocentrum_lima.AAC.1